MSQRTYRAKVDTDYGRRGIVHPGFEAVFPDVAPPDPAMWEPVDGVWPEVKQEAPPHWSDTLSDEMLSTLRGFDSEAEALHVLGLGILKRDEWHLAANSKPANPDAVTGPAQAVQPAEAAAAASADATTTPATGSATARAKPHAKA